MIDLSDTIAPKSDQLNADDLTAGPRTITITRVSRTGTEQPIAIHYEGDNNKPFYPCKSMRRVMVQIWGADGAAYSGRSLTLFRDHEVIYGGQKVGGIRISHASHIAKPVTMALTATQKARRPFTVEPLKAAAAPVQAPASSPPQQQPQKEPAANPVPDASKQRAAAEKAALDLVARMKNAADNNALTAIMSDTKTATTRDRLKAGYADLSQLVETTWEEKAASFANAAEECPF